MKLSLGCGTKIRKGYTNVDIEKLQGVDIVHDLTKFPWPFNNNLYNEVIMENILEHLPNTVKTMEELYRITKPGAKIFISVPYANSWEAITNPTHVRQFNQYTFEFFDAYKQFCKDLSYLSKARFKIIKIGYVFRPSSPHSRLIKKGKPITVIYNPICKSILSFFARFFNNVIIGLYVHLEKEENNE